MSITPDLPRRDPGRAVSGAAVARRKVTPSRRTRRYPRQVYIDLAVRPYHRIAAGLSFGTARQRLVVYGGTAFILLDWNVDVPEQYGFGVGGTFGVGWHPERTVSPYAALAIDRDFNVGDLFDWESLVYVGARVKVTQDPREHFTMTFAAITRLFRGPVRWRYTGPSSSGCSSLA
jgi:hypothetical protein